MSFVKNTRPQQEEKVVSYKCCANGCNRLGTISTSADKWTCAYHHMADPEKWPVMTEVLYENKDILLVIDDLIKISEIAWSSALKDRNGVVTVPERDLHMMLFDDRPHLKPMENEGRSKYEYRLRNYLAEIAGVVGKKKAQTYVATKQLTQFSNPADFF